MHTKVKGITKTTFHCMQNFSMYITEKNMFVPFDIAIVIIIFIFAIGLDKKKQFFLIFQFFEY